jgi:hypothetical protein
MVMGELVSSSYAYSSFLGPQDCNIVLSQIVLSLQYFAIYKLTCFNHGPCLASIALYASSMHLHTHMYRMIGAKERECTPLKEL